MCGWLRLGAWSQSTARERERAERESALCLFGLHGNDDEVETFFPFFWILMTPRGLEDNLPVRERRQRRAAGQERDRERAHTP